MRSEQKTSNAIADVAVVLILFTLGIFAAVAPAAVIAIGIAATIAHRLITRPRVATRDSRGQLARIDRLRSSAQAKAFGRDLHAA